ncbi:dihydropteroate synthase-like protein [Candidatus Bathyarchaeota archaeon]|nr:dihydropteroate synthase-like protein [Candidatus Bathyarchaeota archaeon]
MPEKKRGWTGVRRKSKQQRDLYQSHQIVGGLSLKVLLITGLLAEKTLKNYAEESTVESAVFALKVPVAALLSPEKIAKTLKKTSIQGFDLILVPGLIRGDTSVITNSVGIPTFKGPKYAADLPTVLNALERVRLSTVTPACDLLREELQQKALQELEIVEKNKDVLLKKPGNMLIGKLAVGKDFPMRVLAEIVDAALMSDDEIQRLAKHFVKMGADLIDVGMVSGESRPYDAKRGVEAVKKAVEVPVSIDTLDTEEIKQAVEAGADLILSVDAGNVKQIAGCSSDVAAVIIPTNQREGYFPNKAESRIRFLEEIKDKAARLGMKRIMADLILEPFNVLESMIAFRDFAVRNPDVPLFVGVSNVTELFDADSVGVNALLALLSSEVNASMLLATEKSNKAKGTIREEAVAAKMMFLAKRRGSVPKDLGIDLLVFKEKRKHEETYDRTIEEDAHLIMANEEVESTPMDPRGVFRIIVDHESETIVALHYPTAEIDRPSNVIKGKTASVIYSKILETGLVTRFDHAAYLGRELAKAEISLKTGRGYIQDRELFKQL